MSSSSRVRRNFSCSGARSSKGFTNSPDVVLRIRGSTVSKNIIFCADSNWSGPSEDSGEEQIRDITNVYKFYLNLDGQDTPESRQSESERERVLEIDGRPQQIANYIAGAGASASLLQKMLGGVFGASLVASIVRGYVFLSRNYEPGDRIFVVGYDRGAYVVRSLAGLVATRGLLDRSKASLSDPEHAYGLGMAVWYDQSQKSGKSVDWLDKMLEGTQGAGLPVPPDLLPVEIEAVAVWDTIGALGIPESIDIRRGLEFHNYGLHHKVRRGLHAVAIDEQRSNFAPTLWEPRDGVVQVLFAGSHGDVGGGYPPNESGLSDCALKWMMDELAKLGVLYSESPGYRASPDARAVAHRPWSHSPFDKLGTSLRKFPSGLMVHESVLARMRSGPVIAEPGTDPAPYAPANLSDYIRAGEAAADVSVAYEAERVATQPDDPALIDELGRRPFAEVIADRIEEVWKTPAGSGLEAGAFSVHIHGPWGAGKTSVLNFLRSELQSERRGRWIVVEFNAWRQQRVRPPWWTLINAIYEQAAAQLGLVHSARLRLQWLVWRASADFLPIALASLFIAVAFLFAAAAFSNVTATQASGEAAKTLDLTLKIILALVSAFVAVLAFTRSLVFGSARAAQTYAELRSDPLGPIVQLFKKLVGAVQRPLAVFIDDLDRCDSKYVVELLEGTQTLFRGAPVAYVIAADRKWISSSFEKSYEDFGKTLGEPGRPLGYLFLDKMFQISTSLSVLPSDVRQTYWERLLRSTTAVDPAEREKQRRQVEDEAWSLVRTAHTKEELDAKIKQAGGDPEREQAIRAAAAKQITSPDAKRETEHRLRHFADMLEPNPRSMKRLVNAYALHQATHFLEKRSVSPEALARWTIVELRWPLLAEAFAGNPELVSRMASGKKMGDGLVQDDLMPLLADGAVRYVLFDDEDRGGVLDEKAIREITRSTSPPTRAAARERKARKKTAAK